MKKYLKKFFLIIPILLIALILSSCKAKPNPVIDNPIEQATNVLFTNIENNITDDLVLLTEVDGVKISWLSSNNQVISSTGEVTRQEKDVVVELFAFLAYEDKRLTKSIKVTVKGTGSSNEDPDDPIIIDPIVIDNQYYKGAENLTGLQLKSFLHNLIDDHISFAYTDTTEKLKKTDEDPNNPNNLILFYTGRSQAKTTYNTGNDGWNKEHVWAKSHGNFDTARPTGTDLHNLRPTDATVNSTRGNDDFDEGGSKVNDTYAVGSTFCYYDGDSFEPRDEVKGDVARILFYMAVRYEGDNGEPNLELNDLVNNGSAPYMGRLSILLKWHQEDPVDDFERHRNDVIYSFQNNRNPFIDYPSFAYLIWGN